MRNFGCDSLFCPKRQTGTKALSDYYNTAKEAGLSVEEAQCALRISRQPLSLDQSVGEHDDTYFGEFLEDHREEDPLAEMGHTMLKKRIAAVLDSLEYREREILRLRFGLSDGYAYTLEEVGKIFSVTRERVRQIECKALRALQHPTRAKQLAEFVQRPIAAPLTPCQTGPFPITESSYCVTTQ